MKRVSDDIMREYDKLVADANYYSDAYYNKGQSLISDMEFDKLIKKIETLESMYPFIRSNISPTTNVGYKPSKSDLKQINHGIPMYSISNTYNDEDLIQWMYKISSTYSATFVAEPKFDGISVSLAYENGMLIGAATRGDGQMGEDISHLIPYIDQLVYNLNDNFTGYVRGEMVIPISHFTALNDYRRSQGLEPYKHPRNLAAGTVKLLDFDEIKDRGLIFVPFQVLTDDTYLSQYGIYTQHKVHEWLSNKGFKQSGFCLPISVNNLESIQVIKDTYIDIEKDGVVIKVDELSLHKELGFTSKYPKWATAYKFPQEAKMTKLTDVEISVGKTGKLTPTGVFDPIYLGGAEVTRVTLNNFNYIAERDIRLNDVIGVVKAAEIIPYLDTVFKEYRDGTQVAILPPTNCPVCGSKVEEIDTNHYCTNMKCKGVVKSAIEYLVGRDCLNIQGLGNQTINKLVEENIIGNIIDIFYLGSSIRKVLGEIDVSTKIIDKIEDSYNKAKGSVPVYKLLAGLNIPNIGKSVAKVLSDKYFSLDNLINATYEELVSINGIGDQIANNIIEHMDEIKDLNEALTKNGFQTSEKIINFVDNEAFNNKVFVVTGSFENYNRDDIYKLINIRNGVVSTSVSKKTDYLIAGDKAGSKLDKAKLLNVKIINESELNDLLKMDK